MTVLRTLEIRREIEGSADGERVLLIDQTGITISPRAGIRGLIRDQYHQVLHRLESKLADAYVLTIPLGIWIVRDLTVICETTGTANATLTIKACKAGVTIANAPSQLVTPLILQGTANVVLRGEVIADPLPLVALENFAIAYTGNTTGLQGLMTLTVERIEEEHHLEHRLME